MFQKVQQLMELKKLRDQAMQMQKALAQEFVTEESTINILGERHSIKIVASGDQKVVKLEIDSVEQRELTETINKVLKETQKVAAKKLQEMGGGLGGLLGGQ